MARQVITIIPPRYAVTNGLWLDTISVFLDFPGCFPFSDAARFFSYRVGVCGGCKYKYRVGVRRRIFKRSEWEAYVVIANKRQRELRAASRTNASRLYVGMSVARVRVCNAAHKAYPDYTLEQEDMENGLALLLLLCLFQRLIRLQDLRRRLLFLTSMRYVLSLLVNRTRILTCQGDDPHPNSENMKIKYSKTVDIASRLFNYPRLISL